MNGPIMSKTDIKRSFFGLKAGRPRAEPGTVLVLVGGPSPIVLWPGRQPTAGEGAFGGYTAAYTVDLSPRPINIKDAIVKAKDGLNFLLSFSASYRVSDPIRIVNEQITDGEPTVRNVLLASISRQTQRFDVEQVLDAEERLSKMIDNKEYTEKLPFEISGRLLQLRPDPLAEEHIRKIRSQRNTQELKELAESGSFSIYDKRREYYRQIVDRGIGDMLVENLVKNPDDVGMVTNLMLELDDKRTRSLLDTLKLYVQADMIQDRSAREMVDNLIATAQRQLGLLPSQPKPGPINELTDKSMNK